MIKKSTIDGKNSKMNGKIFNGKKVDNFQKEQEQHQIVKRKLINSDFSERFPSCHQKFNSKNPVHLTTQRQEM